MFQKPMRPADIDGLPTGDQWVIERKRDGWRALCHVNTDGVTLFTRTGNPITQVPYIGRRLSELVPAGSVLDGEIVNLAGGPELNRAREILKTTRNGYQHVPSEQDPALTLVVFDALALDGEDFRERELRERKFALAALLGSLPAGGVVELNAYQAASEAALDAILADELAEGVVIKHLASRYLCGVKGGGAWFKIKRELETEAVCTGVYDAEPGSKYAPTNGSGEPEAWAVGGLCFRVEHDDGRVYEGRAAGMDDRLRSELFTDPEQFTGLTVEIAHRGVEDSGALRNPVFKRFRDTAEKPRQATARTAARAANAGSPRRRRNASSAPKGAAFGGKRKTRNYGAMVKENLLASIESLRNQSGEAYQRCLQSGSGDPAADLVVAEKWARKKGWL